MDEEQTTQWPCYICQWLDAKMIESIEAMPDASESYWWAIENQDEKQRHQAHREIMRLDHDISVCQSLREHHRKVHHAKEWTQEDVPF